MRGTLLNVVTVLVGSGIGLLVGGRLPERVRETVLSTLGLFTVVLGVVNALEAFSGTLPDTLGDAAVLVVLGSLLVGAVVGEAIDLDGRLERLGQALQRRVGARVPAAAGDAVTGPGAGDAVAARGAGDRPAAGRPAGGAGGSRFVEGFVVASLVFCVGPLTILGAISDGLTGDYQLLAVKSLLDGFAALAFASGLGLGVAFSAGTVLVVQGAIALTAGLAEGLITEPMIAAMNAVGGVMILGIGLRLLELRQVRVANLVPALFLAPLLVAAWP